MLGTTFGPYDIEELLGRGGMGEVYRAHDTERDRTVALKVLPPHLAEDLEYQERFRRECRAAARLNEPHIVPIHTFGEIDGRLFLDMRLVEGTDLATWLRTHGAMPPDIAVSVISQIAAALDAAHASGLVHRDVKPSNVLLAGVHDARVDREIFAYLFDFGIARAQDGTGDDPVLTRAGTMPGSLAYIAPERFSGIEGDPRADVYALACVLHQALTGRPPFEGDLATLMRAHLNAPPPRPSAGRPELPPGLDHVVAHGMAKDPAHRPPTAGTLAAAARAEIGAMSGTAHPTQTVARPDWWTAAPQQSAGPAARGAPGRGSAPQQSPQQSGYGPPSGPWNGQPPGWNSHPSHPHQPAYPSHPSHPRGPHPPRTARPGNRTALIAVAVLAVLALAGGALTWVVLSFGSGSGSGSGSGGGTPTTVAQPPPATAPATGATPETARLLAELPAGYNSTNCEPEALPGAVASVVCPGAPLIGTGPTSATFTRYGSVPEMDAAFDSLARAEGIPQVLGNLEDCNTNGTARARYNRQSGGLGGAVGCFTATDGTAYLFWTDEAAVAIAYVGQNQGAAGALFAWWSSVDFVADR